MKKNNWFKRFLAGIGIGVGAAIPGVSGAALAVIFRVYENIIDSVNNFRKDFKNSFKTLLPILIGIFIAVIGCIFLFDIAFEKCMFLLICVFAGFLIGSIPSILPEIKGQPIVPKNIIIAVSGGVIVLALGILSIVLGQHGFSFAEFFDDLLANWWMFFVLCAVGVIASVALTVPGFSGSLILLILGFYKPLISSASDWAKQIFKGNFDNTLALFLMILSFGIGCVIGVVFVSKVMRSLLDKYRVPTFYAIIGFIIGSIPVLFVNFQIWEYYQVWNGATVPGINPAVSQDAEMILGLLALGIAAFFSYMIVRMNNNLKSGNK